MVDGGVYGEWGSKLRDLQLATLANPNSNTYTIRGRYNQFADNYLPVPLYGAAAVLNQQSRYAQVGTTLVGSTLSPAFYDTGEMKLFSFYSIKLQAREVLTSRSPLDVFVNDDAVSLGQRHSVLKARITWYLPPSYIETVDMDLGLGVDISVGPTNRVTVEILAPDPLSIPSVLPEDPFVEANFNTSVAVNVQCAPGTMSNFTGRYTQQVFVEDPGLSLTRDVELRPDARRVQVLADATALPSPQFITRYPFALGSSPTLGRITMEPADVTSLVTEIPQMATHLRITSNPGASNTVAVVQELLR